MQKILRLLLILSILGCNSKEANRSSVIIIEKASQSDEENQDVNIEVGLAGKEETGVADSDVKQQNYVCDTAAVIKRAVSAYLNGSISDLRNDFVSYLKINSKQNCSYPRNEDELLLLYKFTTKLVEDCYSEERAVNVIINLDLYMSKVIEFSESMHNVIPRIALINTLWFIDQVHELKKKDRMAIFENLEYLSSMEEIEELRSNLSLIKESNYQETIALANEAIDRIFEE